MPFDEKRITYFQLQEMDKEVEEIILVGEEGVFDFNCSLERMRIDLHT